MKKHEIIFSLLKLPLDFLIVFLSFFLARDIREISDFIPGVHLPLQFISNSDLSLFAFSGACVYLTVFCLHGLYSLNLTSSKVKEFTDIIFYSFYSMIFYSFFVYFSKGIFYGVEIPRLIIIFSFFICIFGIIFQRILLNKFQINLLTNGFLEKRKIVLVNNKTSKEIQDIISDISQANIYKIIGYINKTEVKSLKINYISSIDELQKIHNKIDEILYIDSDFSSKELYEIWDFSRIFGIRYRYITNGFDVTKTNTTVSLLNKIPVIEIKNTSLDYWGRVIKRIIDLVFSFFGIILISPIFLIVGILIKLEDPKGPIIYKNRRVGQNGKIFNLYKFRYIKWEYCIKDSYGIKEEDDEALKYEKELIKNNSSRKGPLYKIQNDPRKTYIGTFIEKYSIDELPQLFNVFLGNMSLVGPRPHQPREVEKYLTHQKRVLTIKPGITGLAQVNGREKNNFDDEVRLDIFYIENWNFLLDIKIFIKTFSIVLKRK